MRFLILLLLLSFIFSCQPTKKLITEDPYPQASVVIHKKDGTKKEGMVIKREENNLLYIDSETNKRETMPYSEIQRLSKSRFYYDFAAKPIPNYEINQEKGMSNTLLYGTGGLVLGAAAGAGIGIALVGADVDISPLISIGIFGLGGAYYFGSMGSDKDFEDAVFVVQKKHYQVEKMETDKKIAEEKKKLEQQKKEKADLLKQIEEKKKKDD